MACRTSIAFDYLEITFLSARWLLTGTSDPNVWYGMGVEYVSPSVRRTYIHKFVVSETNIIPDGSPLVTDITVASNVNTELRSISAIPGDPISGFWIYEVKGGTPSTARIHTLDTSGAVVDVETIHANAIFSGRMNYNPYLELLTVSNRISGGSYTVYYYDPSDLSLVASSATSGGLSAQNGQLYHTADGATWVGTDYSMSRFTPGSAAQTFYYTDIDPDFAYDYQYMEPNCGGSSIGFTVTDSSYVIRDFYDVSASGVFSPSACNTNFGGDGGANYYRMPSYDGTRLGGTFWDSGGLPFYIEECPSGRKRIPLRQKQRDDYFNTPRNRGPHNAPTSRQASLRSSPGSNTYLMERALEGCGC